MLETGLLLVLIPWSAFWDRNYFFDWSQALSGLMTSNYTRGAISGLGLINVWAALAELADMFGNQQSAIGNRQSAIGNQQSAISNRQSAIGNQQSAIGNQQSAVGNQQSAVGNQQSAVGNQQSDISNHQ